MGKSRKKASMLPEKILLCTFPIWFFGGIILYFGVLGRPREYKFGQDTGQIQTIEIVDDSYGNSAEIPRLGMVEQDLWPTFFSDFEQVECRKYVNDPCLILDGKGVRITYADNSYEVITYSACCYYSAQRNYKEDFNWCHFNKEQFEGFILKYLDESSSIE